MNFKKITAFVTALAMCCSLTSCGNNDTVSSSGKDDSIELTADSNSDSIFDTDDIINNNTAETFKSDKMSFDYIFSQCSGCEEVLKMRISLAKANSHLVSSDENRDIYLQKLGEIEGNIYSLMQHDCTADILYVENYPLVCGQYHGTYTGYWNGGGPVGQGTFTARGYVPVWQQDSLEIVYNYSGEWQYGLPDGQGAYQYQSFTRGLLQNNNYYQEYVGGMKVGKKSGYGTEYEKYPSHEFYYNTGYYENNRLTELVYYNEFDLDGNLLSAGYAGDVGNGQDIMHMNIAEYTYRPGEAKMQAQGLLILTSVVAGALLLGYLDDSTASSYGTSEEQQMAALESYRQQKAEQDKKSAEEQALKDEEFKKYCESKYYEYKANDPDEWSLDTQYFKANMY